MTYKVFQCKKSNELFIDTNNQLDIQRSLEYYRPFFEVDFHDENQTKVHNQLEQIVSKINSGDLSSKELYDNMNLKDTLAYSFFRINLNSRINYNF